jgi:RNA polymerase sigma-70 factor (ECF subfamily)
MLFTLMNIASDADRDLVEQLYRQYRRLVFGIAWRILDDIHLADDAVQETFVRIIHYLERFRTFDCNDLAGLIVIISKNVSLDIRKHQKKIKEIPLEEWLTDENEDELVTIDYLDALQSHRELVTYLDKLPGQYRETLYLKHVFGFSNVEIADLMKIKPDTVRVWIHRARRLVIAAWRQQHPEGGDRSGTDPS